VCSEVLLHQIVSSPARRLLFFGNILTALEVLAMGGAD